MEMNNAFEVWRTEQQKIWQWIGKRIYWTQAEQGMAGYKSVNEWKKRNMSETFGPGYVVSNRTDRAYAFEKIYEETQG